MFVQEQLMPRKITLLDYKFKKAMSNTILSDMLNKVSMDYSSLDDLISHYGKNMAKAVRKAVEELNHRNYLFQVEKNGVTVYAVNKLRISNMEFMYGIEGMEDD